MRSRANGFDTPADQFANQRVGLFEEEEVQREGGSPFLQKMTPEPVEAALKSGGGFTKAKVLEPGAHTEDRSAAPPKGPSGVDVPPTEESAKTEGENIIQKIEAFVRRFVFLQETSQYTLLAAWILGTYLYQEFECTGYVFAHSPEPQSGKTTLLEVFNLLVAKATGIQYSPTEATIFRTADGYTQIFDEIDSWNNKENLRAVLNAGYRTGSTVTRLERGANSAFVPKKFPVYGPKVLAGIGLTTLERTTRDRAFAVAMVRQKKSEKRERLMLRQIKAQVANLAREITAWVTANKEAVRARYEGQNFPYLQRFGDRTIEISEPLAAVIEVVFKGDPYVDKARAALVDAIATTRNEQQSETDDHRILQNLLELSKQEDPLTGNASELAVKCSNLMNPVSEYTLSQVLRRYGFKAKSVRKPGEVPKYRYTLPGEKLRDVVERWATPEKEEQDTTKA